jgi:uncharacterized protein (TIGR04141 family)
VSEKTKVFAVSAKHDGVLHQWSAFRCLYAEVVTPDGKVYLLNNGKWYHIAKKFADEVLQAFANLPESNLQFIDYKHANENAYNKALAQSLNGSCCMDGDNIVYVTALD